MNLDAHIARAVKRYWTTRQKQKEKQGSSSGVQDSGSRSHVTGGKQMDGFAELICELLHESGLNKAQMFSGRRASELPGFYRPEKNWDWIVVADGRLLGLLELKSQVGPSFGNNFNNRVEEALGNATDLWKAYSEGTFAPSQQPWAGYLMLLEDCKESQTPVRVCEPHFSIRPEFQDASYVRKTNPTSVSYAKRYEIFCRKLTLERLYSASCFLMSDQVSGQEGKFSEPAPDLTFKNFVASLIGKVAAHRQVEGTGNPAVAPACLWLAIPR
jgi:hypothetical protein